jgi:hypothetical protein
MGDRPLTPAERDEARALLADLGSLRYEFRTESRHPSGWNTWRGEHSPAVLRAISVLLLGPTGFHDRYLDSVEVELKKALAAVQDQRANPRDLIIRVVVSDEDGDE